MKELGISSILLIVVLSSVILLVIAQDEPIVVVYEKGLKDDDKYLKWMMKNITEVNWRVYTEKLTYEDIKDANTLILVLVDPVMTFTDEEISIIKDWLDSGAKTLWITGDNDYKTDFPRIAAANKVLEAIGSRLRIEHCEAADVKSNCGADYRVAAMIEPDRALEFLKEGITKPVLFHGSAPLIIHEKGRYIALEKKAPRGIFRIAWTSDGGKIAEITPPRPELHEIGASGRFVLMAAEILPRKNLLIVSSESPVDHYKGIWISEYHGVELDGPKFVKNVILWGVGLKGRRIPLVIPWEWVSIGVASVAAIIFIVLLILKTKAKT